MSPLLLLFVSNSLQGYKYICNIFSMWLIIHHLLSQLLFELIFLLGEIILVLLWEKIVYEKYNFVVFILLKVPLFYYQFKFFMLRQSVLIVCLILKIFWVYSYPTRVFLVLNKKGFLPVLDESIQNNIIQISNIKYRFIIAYF